MQELKITVSEYDEELARINLKENTFTYDPDGLTKEQIKELKKDLEANNGNN